MSHKRMTSDGSLGVQLSLIITPMLDMSFQILAFFIMIYHPAALEGHIPGNLLPPDGGAVDKRDPEPMLPANDPELSEWQDAITVQVNAVVQGQDAKRLPGTPSQIFLRTNLDAAPAFLEGSDVADFSVALGLLEKRLKQLAGPDRKANVKIAGDGGLRYQYVLMVYDAAKRAGFEKIHFVSPQLKATIKR